MEGYIQAAWQLTSPGVQLLTHDCTGLTGPVDVAAAELDEEPAEEDCALARAAKAEARTMLKRMVIIVGELVGQITIGVSCVSKGGFCCT